MSGKLERIAERALWESRLVVLLAVAASIVSAVLIILAGCYEVWHALQLGLRVAFGPESLAYASVYYVTTALLFNTVGVVIVSLGHLNLKNAFLSLFKVPAIYAIGIALVFIQTGWQLPVPIQRAVSLAAGGAVPLMLVLLGLELQRTQWTRDLLPLSVTAGLRLLAGPLVGFLMSALFGLSKREIAYWTDSYDSRGDALFTENAPNRVKNR